MAELLYFARSFFLVSSRLPQRYGMQHMVLMYRMSVLFESVWGQWTDKFAFF